MTRSQQFTITLPVFGIFNLLNYRKI